MPAPRGCFFAKFTHDMTEKEQELSKLLDKKRKESVQQTVVNMKEGNDLPDGITQETIDAWKKRYGQDKIKLGELPLGEDRTQFLAVIGRVPDRKTVGEFEKWMDKDPNKSKEILINACILSGKEQVKEDDFLFYGAFDFITNLLPVAKSTIKNL